MSSPSSCPAPTAPARRRWRAGFRARVEDEPLTAVPGRELRLAVSCGLASFPEDASDSGALMRHADGQMYAAKAARYGRGRGV